MVVTITSRSVSKVKELHHNARHSVTVGVRNRTDMSTHTAVTLTGRKFGHSK